MKKIIGTIKFGTQTVLLHIEDEALAEFIRHEYVIDKRSRSPISHKAQVHVLSDGHQIEYLLQEGNKLVRRIEMDINISVNVKEFILQGLIELSLCKNGFYFMHGSSYVVNKNLFVFLGPSGSGKTTILQLLKPNCITSNDTIVLRRGRKNSISLYISPFDANSTIKQLSKKINIKNVKIYKLTKNKINTISTLEFHEKVELLIKNMNLNMLAMQTNIASIPTLKTTSQRQAVKMALNLQKSSEIHNLNFNLDITRAIFLNIIKHE